PARLGQETAGIGRRQMLQKLDHGDGVEALTEVTEDFGRETMLGRPIPPVRVVDLRGAEVDAQALDAAQVVADEGAGPAADIQDLADAVQAVGDRVELQVVPEEPYARLALMDLVIKARWDVSVIVVTRSRHRLFSGHGE